MAFGLATIGLVLELYSHFVSLGICLQQYNQADPFRPITGQRHQTGRKSTLFCVKVNSCLF